MLRVPLEQLSSVWIRHVSVGGQGSLALLPAPQEAQEGKLAHVLSSDPLCEIFLIAVRGHLLSIESFGIQAN